jgi:sugar/nucleoside kinase (ribokinase family)
MEGMMERMREFDVISVGDITTDAIVRLFDNDARVYENAEGKWLAIPFGTKLPFEEAYIMEAVGNASNAAVSFARLGLTTGFVTNVGGDKHGIDMINALHDNNVDTRFVRVNPNNASNYHYALWYKDERTMLIKHESYEYHWPELRPEEVPGWLYFSSVSKHAMKFHDEIADWIEKHPGSKLAFQPGTYQLEAGPERLKRIYQATEVLILNREEAALVSGAPHDDVHGLLDRLHDLGPGTVVITDGPDGAYASDRSTHWTVPIYPNPRPPFERTGAGDAFASTFVTALVKGKTVEDALRWAPINAMHVVQYVGAQEGLLSSTALERLLHDAPESYRARPF